MLSVKRHGHGGTPLRVVTRPFPLLRTGVLVCQERHHVTDKAGRAYHDRQSILGIVCRTLPQNLMFIYSGDGPDDSVAAPWQRTETKKGVPNQSIMATRSLTYANFRRVARCYVRGVPWAERPGLRSIFDRYNAWSRVMRKNLVTLAVGATVAIGAFASPTTADAR